jgi:CubicO group peptidase (beta-lactamase class C family)
MVALSLLILIDRGQLNFDDTVAAHWPEFAVNGKSEITLAQLMSHQAGLPGVRHELSLDTLYDWEQMTSALAAEIPWWDPGTEIGYHVNTLGFLGGEIVRRVSGQSFGEFFAREVAGPLGADFQFGLSPGEDACVADFVFPTSTSMPQPIVERSDASLVYANPVGASGIGTVNSRRWRAAVHPSTNGHANARAIAGIYAPLANGGKLENKQLLSSSVLSGATKQFAVGHDRILDRPSRFGFGFQLSFPARPLGLGPAGFGHFGAGGSLGMADPDAKMSFGYCMNRFGLRWQDPRNRALLASVYDCL